VFLKKTRATRESRPHTYPCPVERDLGGKKQKKKSFLLYSWKTNFSRRRDQKKKGPFSIAYIGTKDQLRNQISGFVEGEKKKEARSTQWGNKKKNGVTGTENPPVKVEKLRKNEGPNVILLSRKEDSLSGGGRW